MCYQNDIAPKDMKQNCALWEYDNGDDVYLSSMTVRKIIYYATPLITYAMASYFTGWMAANNIGQSFLGNIASFSLETITPFLAFKGKTFLEINDAIYSLLERDEVLEDTILFNNLMSGLDHFIRSNTGSNDIVGTNAIEGYDDLL